jgi:hypothetical protein
MINEYGDVIGVNLSRQIWHGCIGKIRHPSKRHAVAALRKTIAHSHSPTTDYQMNAYKCACGKWHIGHNRFAVQHVATV